MSARQVVEIVTAHQQHHGKGFTTRRAFPTQGLDMVDPLLVLDELGPMEVRSEDVEPIERPLRGFEIVTYLLEGECDHRDSTGGHEVQSAEEVVCLTAGAGLVHRHAPSARVMQQKQGRLHGFELWLNLPSKDKRAKPRLQRLTAEALPETSTVDERARVRVLAGEALGVTSPLSTHTPLLLHHWSVSPSAEIEVVLPQTHNVCVYVFDGSLQVADKVVERGQLAVLGLRGGYVRLAVATDATAPSQALVIGGTPLREPVAWGDSFVMNTRDEVLEAIDDYQSGKLGKV